MPRFHIDYRVTGTVTQIIEASDLEAAKQVAEDVLKREAEHLFDIEEISDASSYVQQLFRVKRDDGKVVTTTYVRPTDEVLPDSPRPAPKQAQEESDEP